MLTISSLYIHIPFCTRKCNYCDFLSFSQLKEQDKYVSYLIKEIKKYELSKLKTIYFGGGTPSLLSIDNIKKILENLSYDEATEITLELNPSTVDREKLQAFYKLGINRLSIGIQSFNDENLKILGRLHSSKEAIDCYKMAREIGFKNISLDLMFSLPKQSLEGLEEDLRQLFLLEPEHFSIYSLIWEEGTDFFEKLEKGIFKETDIELETIMYETIIAQAEKTKYRHYEISNFSKAGFESKHNINYWENNFYVGVGLGASGYIADKRYCNYRDFSKYYTALDEDIFPIDEAETEILTKDDEKKYKYLAGLRMLGYGVELDEKYIDIAKKLSDNAYINIIDNKIYMTKKGLMFYNDVILNFL